MLDHVSNYWLNVFSISYRVMHRRYYFYQTTELVFSPDFQSCVRQFLLLYDLFDFFLDKESRHYNSDPEQTEVTSCYDFVVVVVVVDKNKTP